MSKKKPTIINNLSEFLSERGFSIDEPYYWARCFYKYNDCGPWAVFLLKDKPAITRSICFAISRSKSGKLHLAYDEEGYGDRDKLEPEDLLAFGIEPDRTIKRDLARSLKKYRKLVEDFAKETGTGYSKITVHTSHPHSGEPTPHHVWVSATQEIPATIKELYYEDLRKEGATMPTNENCIGIEFGSIVEGSEANSGPFYHYFPFDMALFDRDVEYMEKETSFYWERDNSMWYHARRTDDHSDQYSLHESWGDIKWDSDKPRSRKLKKALEEYILTDEACNADTGEYRPLPNMPGWEVGSIVNDYCY